MDKDLKDTIKKLEEAKSKQEKIERIIILLSGLLIVIIFSIIGINVYSGKEETISEPEINIIAKQKKEEKNTPPAEKTVPKVEKKEDIKSPEQPVKAEKVIEEKKVEKPKTVQEKISTPLKTEKKVAEKTPEKASKKTEEKPKKEQKKVAKNPFPSGYYIQAGAFSTKKKAEKLLKKLNMPNAKIRKEGELYKVLIGSFKNRKEAYRFMKEKNIKGFVRKI
ncbi:Cell division protein DedD (protein involved in septation) [Persephonella hydrogeniphila]|uniref:Cell division protein DedD (Protein involved in septation) n=1 Tax=Persephonella hydrogeniphila TaxID=198703 RepID=A0A285NMK4_9AQUI|nr:SPOR domain-containing protein [Persephonella hydrogeniphila]SNZ10163.1 Cell division protein DedD (protein involved in septation) [Persephonella hydrogeniphila]